MYSCISFPFEPDPGNPSTPLPPHADLACGQWLRASAMSAWQTTVYTARKEVRNLQNRLKSLIDHQPLGLQWARRDHQQIQALAQRGVEVHNPALADRLQHTTRLTLEEWKTFCINDLSCQSFVKSAWGQGGFVPLQEPTPKLSAFER